MSPEENLCIVVPGLCRGFGADVGAGTSFTVVAKVFIETQI
jgi:hypothetical protein